MSDKQKKPFAEDADGSQTDASLEPLVESIQAKLPDDVELPAEVASQLAVEIRGAAYSGPLPPPEMLANYEKVLPGLAAQIVERADREQSFRHKAVFFELEAEREKNREENKIARRGQYFGFCIALLGILGSIYLIATGKELTGLGSLVTVLTVLVTVFITGKKSEHKKSENAQDPSD